MSSSATARQKRGGNLDNLTLARKEGWREYVEAPKRVRPEALSKREIRRLNEAAVDIYNQWRADWHNNLGPFRTPQFVGVQEALWDIMDSNTQDGNRAKGAVAIDGYPGLGKSCAAEEFAKQFHQREIRRHSEFTRAGDERWPVCRIGMRGNTSMKDFNTALCDFYAHPGRRRATAEQLGKWALDCVLSCETRLLIIDLHFLRWRNTTGVAISNHFKYIANDYLQLNRNRSERISGGSEIPGIASWMGLPSVVHHGAGGRDEGAARGNAGHGVRVVDGARRGSDAVGAGRAVPGVSGVDREVAEHDQGVCP